MTQGKRRFIEVSYYLEITDPEALIEDVLSGNRSTHWLGPKKEFGPMSRDEYVQHAVRQEIGGRRGLDEDEYEDLPDEEKYEALVETAAEDKVHTVDHLEGWETPGLISAGMMSVGPVTDEQTLLHLTA